MGGGGEEEGRRSLCLIKVIWLLKSTFVHFVHVLLKFRMRENYFGDATKVFQRSKCLYGDISMNDIKSTCIAFQMQKTTLVYMNRFFLSLSQLIFVLFHPNCRCLFISSKI